jgi:endonuclease YncB( thermonuclease family)
MLAAAWYYGKWTDQRQPVPVAGQKLLIMDGDSFVIGPRKLRLDGIDAPEFRQVCKDAVGKDWPCGRTARAALEKLLTEPGLACEAEVQDRYGRSLATCRTAQTPDIAAAQVRDGMAVSDEFNGMRSYGDEEDAASDSKRGIWQGEFMRPAEWRAGRAGTPAL